MFGKGDIYKTNYSSRMYQVHSIIENCKCARFSDEMGLTSTGMENESPEHLHIISIDLVDNRRSGHNGYVFIGDRIKSIWTEDEILIVSEIKNKQLSLF